MTDNLAAALAAVQANLPQIPKSERAVVETKGGGSYSYTYADLAGVSEKILPLLGKNGLSFSAWPTLDGDRLILRYVLLHESGESRDGEYPLPSSGTPQAIGSAITYARRYCLCAVTGAAPEDDDDAAAAQAEADGRKGTAQRRQPAPSRPAPEEAKKPADKKAPAAMPPLPHEDGAQRSKGVTPPQMAKIMALFNELGVKERDERLHATRVIIGREITSAKELRIDEGSKLIEALGELERDDDPHGALVALLAEAAHEAVQETFHAEIVEDGA